MMRIVSSPETNLSVYDGRDLIGSGGLGAGVRKGPAGFPPSPHLRHLTDSTFRVHIPTTFGGFLVLTKTLIEIAPTVGAPVDTIEGWIRRFKLASTFEKTVRGRARGFSRANTLELTSISAFLKAGIKLSMAVAMAAAMVHMDKRHGRVREWVLFPEDDNKGVAFESLHYKTLTHHLEASWPPVVRLVHTGAIFRRVNELYEAE